MLFTSLEFLLFFLPVVYGVNFLLRGKARNYWLFLASLFFYAWGEPTFVLVMLGSIGMNYLMALGIEKGRPGKSRGLLVLALAANLLLLIVFKYLNFLTETIHALLPGTKSLFPQTRIALPLGISFFTFQSISYIIDVYRGTPVQRNPAYLGLYISLFPQLIAGPIVRYSTIAEEINGRTITYSDFSEGVFIFLRGFNKKVLLANVLAEAADKAFGMTDQSVCMAWFGAFCYALQIYFDFDGYSEIAIGLGRTLGFHFESNFDHPYASATLSEFWRRWHISLGRWFRDYVYFPLGGSRVSGRGKLIRNLMLVWLLTGIWHGAAWTFILWGIFLGVLITAEKLLEIPQRLKKRRRGLPHLLYRILVLFLVVLGWVLFRANHLAQAGLYLRSMFGLNGNRFLDDTFCFYGREYLTVFLAGILGALPTVRRIIDGVRNHGHIRLADFLDVLTPWVQLILFIVSVSCLIMGAHNPFIYFNF